MGRHKHSGNAADHLRELTPLLGKDKDAHISGWRQMAYYCLYVFVPLVAFTGFVVLFALYSHAHWHAVMTVAVVSLVFSLLLSLSSQCPAEKGKFETCLVGGLTCLAIFFAIVAGRYVYVMYFASYDEFTGLVTYVNIDPAADHGASYTDAGEVYFKEGSRVDTGRTVSFVAGDVYCAAPIVRDGGADAKSMDWFVVGTNCCQPPIGELFKCMEPGGRSGLRLLDDARRPMFALAVDEWTSQYDTPADHPLFFEWVLDPHAVVVNMQLQGWTQITMFAEVALVVAAVLTAWFSFCIEEMRQFKEAMGPSDGPVSAADGRDAFLQNEDEEEVIATAVYQDEAAVLAAAERSHQMRLNDPV